MCKRDQQKTSQRACQVVEKMQNAERSLTDISSSKSSLLFHKFVISCCKKSTSA